MRAASPTPSEQPVPGPADQLLRAPTKTASTAVRQGSKREPAKGRRFTLAEKVHALTLFAAGMKRAQVAETVGTTTESLRWVAQAEAAGTMPKPPGETPRTSGAETDREEVAESKPSGQTKRSFYTPKDPGQGLSPQEQAAILGRDQDLFDAVLVDATESAERVVDVVTRACAQLPGAQLLTDRGTPYLAERTREALRDLEVEHAPQREGDPRGKATVERAFETAKSVLGPVLRLTDRIAAAAPALASSEHPQATATVPLTVTLRAYQAGARAARSRRGAPSTTTSSHASPPSSASRSAPTIAPRASPSSASRR